MTENAKAPRASGKKPRTKRKTTFEKAGPETRPARLVFRLHAVLISIFPHGVDARSAWALASAGLSVAGLTLLASRWARVRLL